MPVRLERRVELGVARECDLRDQVTIVKPRTELPQVDSRCATVQALVNSPERLQKLLKVLDLPADVNHTTLELSPCEEHVIPPNRFYVFLKKDHVVIRSSGPEMAVVHCKEMALLKVGLALL